jgi:XRE family transcriptional regulator, regulator of sulfur utilization
MNRQREQVAQAFGAALRAARRDKGLTQEQLAEIGGFDRSYPSLLERGLRTPTLGVIFRLADALGVDAPQLVLATVERTRGPKVAQSR